MTYPTQLNPSELEIENTLLKQQLLESHKNLRRLENAYAALEEDFLHALDRLQASNAKTIVLIGGDARWTNRYRAVSDNFKTKLVLLNEQGAEFSSIIENSDEVICARNCPNRHLCQQAKLNCKKFDKTIHEISSVTPQDLHDKLAQISITTP